MPSALASLLAAASTPWVDWSELGKTVVIGLAAAVGAVAFFSLGLVALQAAGVEVRESGADPADASAPPGGGALKAAPLAAAVVCFLVVAAIVTGGIYITFKK